MSEPYIGEIRCFGFNFAPRDWAFCNGQLMSIAQNEALFAIIGTIYGGNGTSNFALPDLQGRIPMHWGNNAGFNTIIGQQQGVTDVTLTTLQIPSHQHKVISATVASSMGADEAVATPSATAFLGPSTGGIGTAYNNAPPSITDAFSNKAISYQGGSQAHENMQPYLVLNFCIALFGIFPTQS